jgi:protein-S-isoprenylcysteine O-methyltransferase Ste14
MSAREPPSLRRQMKASAILAIGMAALLFIPAGTVYWPGAWVLIFELTAIGFVTERWLARHDPALLAERRSSLVQNGQADWDRILMRIVPVLWLAWLPLMALDAIRFRFSAVPVWVQTIGALLLGLSYFIVYRTYRVNSYAAPVVRIQRERGQRVVTTGPYRYVRHPIYASGILTYIGIPLLLGSWGGLAMAPIMTIVLGIRAVFEERLLAAELEGYRDYIARVRYRLVPAIW